MNDGYDSGSGTVENSPKARMAATMQRYVDEFERVPVLVLPCLVRYREPTPFEGASIFPSCQNLLLAARALGYGGVLTGWHFAVEDELRRLLGVPEGVFMAATITIGRPEGSHGPVRRRPLSELVFGETWDAPPPWAVDPVGTRHTAAGPPKGARLDPLPRRRAGWYVRERRFPRHLPGGSRAVVHRRAVPEVCPMAEIPRPPSRESSQEEREFWDTQFRDDPRPRRRAGRAASPRREPPLAATADGPLGRLVDRVRDWRTDARLGVVVLVLVAVVAGVVWYRIGVGGASAGEAASAPRAVTTTVEPAGAASGPLPQTTGKGSLATIAVHVAGAVTHPGVVELRAGARVIDAVEAVGGALGDGDLDRLNLAAKVADGQRIYVAEVGQADPGIVGDAGGVGTAPGADGSGAPGAKVNLNTASQAQLEELPGIGPTYAQAIIAERQRRGGFKSVNDLRSVRGIGDKRFAELAPLVTV